MLFAPSARTRILTTDFPVVVTSAVSAEDVAAGLSTGGPTVSTTVHSTDVCSQPPSCQPAKQQQPAPARPCTSQPRGFGPQPGAGVPSPWGFFPTGPFERRPHHQHQPTPEVCTHNLAGPMLDFFGASASRKDTALPSYTEKLQKASEPKVPPKRASAVSGVKRKPSEAELEKLRKEEQGKKLKQNRDFGSLLNCGGGGSGTKNAAEPARGDRPLSAKNSQPGALKGGRCAWCMGKGCRECQQQRSAAPPPSSSSRPAGKAPQRSPSPAGSAARNKPLKPTSGSNSILDRHRAAASGGKAADQSKPTRVTRPAVPTPLNKSTPGTSRALARPDGSKPVARLVVGGSSQRPASAVKQRNGPPPSRTSSQAGTSGRFSQTKPGPTKLQRPREAPQPRKMDRQDSFEVSDDDEGDWRRVMRSITGYDPSKYKDEKDDRNMVAGWQTVQAEESRSKRLGRDADRQAEMEEENRMREKYRLKKQLKARLGRK